MFITQSFKKSLIVEQFQGNYLKQNFSEVRRCFSGRNLRFFYPKHGVTVIQGCVSEVSSLHFIRREIDE